LSSSRPPKNPRPPLQPWQAAQSAAAREQQDPACSQVPFREPRIAANQLRAVSQLLSPALAESLPTLLAESPDPDSALILFERLVSTSQETVPLLNRYHFLAHYAIVVFGYSHYLGETLLQNNDLLPAFLREKNLDRSFGREEFHESLARFRSRSFETDVSLILARFKRREYVRIMLRDVLKLAPLAETAAEISALADVLIEDALREADSRLQRRYGLPQHLDPAGRLVDTPFVIFSLGKLGGNELNYSSDVDLMYMFGDGEEAPGAAISNHEYFVRLAQEATEILSRVTREGPVFRIDLRLRPQGQEGELAITVSHALKYYELVAEDWERQALIKIRYSAGDATLARQFVRGVQPYIYTSKSGASDGPASAFLENTGHQADRAPERLNFAAIKTALEARERMHTRGRRNSIQRERESGIDVKIDRGGIRDIEFLVQCLQRVYGGAEPWLRSGGTLFALQKLHDKRHISSREFHELTGTYEFLRHLEHRLQLREGQQTHRLPASSSALEILRRSMEGYAPGEDQTADLVGAVRTRMAKVEQIQRHIIHQEKVHGSVRSDDAAFVLRGGGGPANADQANQQTLELLVNDLPVLREALSHSELTLQARKHLLRFLSATFTSSDRYATVLRYPDAMERAITIFDSSDYLSEILIRHPEEIAALVDLDDSQTRPGSGYLFENELRTDRARDPVFSYLPGSTLSYSEKQNLIRQHYRHRLLVSGATDLTIFREIYRSLETTSSIAEDAIAAAFEIAGSPKDMAVMALGRLGSLEFDVLSDADLLFVCDEGQDLMEMTKAASQLIQVLASYTNDGMVFPVDARLRPRGAEGELVVTPAQMGAYVAHEAQAWEALMYTKLRFVVGSRKLARKTIETARQLFRRFAADSDFASQIGEMRQKLEASDAPEKSFKTSPGGTYDLDFLTGYLLIKNDVPENCGTLRDRIWRCHATGGLGKADAAVLDHGAELLRTVEHVVRLVIARAHKWLPGTEHAQQVTEKLTARFLGREFPKGLETELVETLQEIRAIYSMLLPS
jgi:[glutamine synthetase] adenylyltransferase / [glutamine synthetase]-adenylyl-L-tyrosine phosphorylase